MSSKIEGPRAAGARPRTEAEVAKAPDEKPAAAQPQSGGWLGRATKRGVQKLEGLVDGAANALLNLDRGRPTKLGGPLETTQWLKDNYGEWFHDSPRKDGALVADPTPWPDPLFGPGVKGTNVFVHNVKTVDGVPPE